MVDMPTLLRLVRSRRETRSESGNPRTLGYFTVWSISILGLSLVLVAFGAAILYSNLIVDLPTIGSIQELFSLGGDDFPSPVQVFDPSGENLLATLIYPHALEREWVQVGSALPPGLPEVVIDAVIAAEDETFWSHHGFDTRRTLTGILDSLRGVEEQDLYRSIPQRLVYMSVLPSEDFSRSQTSRYIRSAVLAQNLVERYSKEQVLEWYLNSAQFGRLSQGIDSASLVYFDKHSSELSLAEGAILAVLLDRPDLKPDKDFALLKESQGVILARMTNLGMITRDEFHTALDQALSFAEWVIEDEIGLAIEVERELREALGLVLSQRPSLMVYSTIDPALQAQVVCTSRIYLDRMAGSSVIDIVDAYEECPTSSSLQPLRPSDLGVDHLVDHAALIAIDPQSGEIKALFGDVAKQHSQGEMAFPFLYLSAFARGYSPGSMILDLPDGLGVDETVQPQDVGSGPVRMRNAIIGGYGYAADRTLDLVGEESFLQMMGQLGVRSEIVQTGGHDDLLPASLFDLSYAYTAFANLGIMSGRLTSPSIQSSSLSPVLISSIRDSNGEGLYETPRARQSILGPALAYLLVDVLTDSSTRGSILGNDNIFEFDQQVAVMPEGENEVATDSWTIGFIPSLVVGVRVGNTEGDSMYRTSREIGAGSLWRAVMEYGLSTVDIEVWEMPPEMIEIEVCEPSGLLPTGHCPRTVRELYIRGTEPTQYDNFYVPIKINLESGKLATIFTPADLVEEQIFLTLPPEAKAWADLQGYAQPPTEYDAVRPDELDDAVAAIEFPSMFTTLSGTVRVRGKAVSDAFQYYRLQYGRGLNPAHWFVIGEDHLESQRRGLLSIWDTDDLEGLYTLQLAVVDRDGTLNSSFVHVTVDNHPPEISLEALPSQIDLRDAEDIQLLTRVEDNLGIQLVEFLVDGLVVSSSSLPPYLGRIAITNPGEYQIVVRAYDLAGNLAESEVQVVRVTAE